MSATICAVCSGYITTSNLVSRPSEPAWVHLNDEDWVDNVHQAVPTSAVTP